MSFSYFFLLLHQFTALCKVVFKNPLMNEGNAFPVEAWIILTFCLLKDDSQAVSYSWSEALNSKTLVELDIIQVQVSEPAAHPTGWNLNSGGYSSSNVLPSNSRANLSFS